MAFAPFSPPETSRSIPYFHRDLRLGWRPRKDLELSLVGANLFGGVTWNSCRKPTRSRSKSNAASTATEMVVLKPACRNQLHPVGVGPEAKTGIA
jgi:hypothetical protein